MRKHSMILTGGLALAAATSLPFGLGQPALAAGTPHYDIIDLGTLGGSFTDSLFLNNRGDITGVSFSPGDTALRGFLWRDGHLRDVGTLGGPQAAATDINESGQFAGWSNTTAPAPPSIFNQASVFCNTPMAAAEPTFACHAFLSQHGTNMDLGTLGGVNSAAENKGINDAGQVVGVAETTSVDPTSPNGAPTFHAFLWRWGRMIDLGTLGKQPDSIANAVNDLDQVVGADVDANAQNAVGWVWQDGRKTPLGTLGGSSGVPFALNDLGQVVGLAAVAGNTTGHAFLWQRGRMTDLGTLPGDVFSEAFDITNDGKIVGQSCSPDFFQCRAALWSSGNVIDLNQALSPTSGWQVTDAEAINARGQITGGGVINGEFHAFLMTPVH